MSTGTAFTSESIGWGDKSRPGRPAAQHDLWPRPLSAAAYHGVLGDIVKTIEPQTEADPAALLVQMLVMFGSVIGRTAHFRAGADRHHLNLFAGVVGQTAKGRKGVSRGQAQRIFEPIDSTWTRCITSGLSSGEGLIWAVRDAIEKQQPIKHAGRVIDYQSVIEDPGIDDKRLLVVESELASTLKVMSREGNTLSAVVRQAWDGHDLRTLTKSSAARATQPHISIIGHITRDELRRYLEATEAANGFGNRFLWVCVKRSKELPDGGAEPLLSGFVDRLRDVVTHARTVGELTRDAHARSLWHRIYGRLSAGRPGMLGAMTGRAEAQVMRIACLYALADKSSVVGLPHLRAALEVWRYCERSAAYLFGDRLGHPVADEILHALRDAWPESLTRSDITRGLFSRNRSAAEVNRGLGVLSESQLARVEDDRSGPGRPVERWYSVNDDDINELNDITSDGGVPDVVNVVNVVDHPASEVPYVRIK
ncbi:MAG TPA: DUF3987 domain-containing protein [Gemmatimonadaceae bacterium]|nr:DUF3987 domain-containing protein [Gemmatimonadaceae bacterium]